MEASFPRRLPAVAALVAFAVALLASSEPGVQHLAGSGVEAQPTKKTDIAAGGSGILLMQRSPVSLSRSPPQGDSDAVSELQPGIAHGQSEAVANLTGEVQELKQMIKAMQQSLETKMQGCCRGCPSPGPPTPELGPGLCAVFGDPHFTTFDGAHTILLQDLTLWLVKSEEVWIQGLSQTTMGNFMGFAVGGPFLDGHTLILYNSSINDSSDEPGKLVALFDGEPILADWDAQGNAEYEEPFVMWAARRTEWNTSLHDQEILEMDQVVNWTVGPWPERFQTTPKGGLYLFRFPRGIEITTTGVDFMSAVIKMAPEAKGQSGFCGNFNGIAEDDFEPASFGSAPPQTIAAWNRPIGDGLEPVLDSANLFKLSNATARLALLAAASSATIAKVDQPCTESRMHAAQQACSEIPSHLMRLACITDVCLTGNPAAAFAVAEAELLQEHVNARGLHVFLGHGLCVDQDGKRFRALSAPEVRSGPGCENLLGSMRATRGVLGAQLRVEGSCEILVDLSTDIAGVAAAFAPGGGWAEGAQAEVSAEMSGRNYVAGVVENLNWSCWRLN